VSAPMSGSRGDVDREFAVLNSKAATEPNEKMANVSEVNTENLLSSVQW
jgi:hypothetical protein